MTKHQRLLFLENRLKLESKNVSEDSLKILSEFEAFCDKSIEWDELSKEQQKAIHIGVKQLDEGKGKEHSLVIQGIKQSILNT